MQSFSKITLTLLLAVTWLIGSALTEPHAETDEKGIRDAAQKYQDAYNGQDATKFAALWASDATYLNPVTGESAEGREAIEKLFKEKFTQGKKRHLEVNIKDIEFPSENEAIENGGHESGGC